MPFSMPYVKAAHGAFVAIAEVVDGGSNPGT
jgi:hypothetical protein